MSAIIETLKEIRFLRASRKEDKISALKYTISNEEREQIKHIVEAIRKNGYYVLEGYYDETRCEAIKTEIERLISDTDKLKIEGGDYRQYGADRLSGAINEFNKNGFLNNISNEFHQCKSTPYFTLAAKITYKQGTLGSGGGWHRDTYRPYQFKSMLYLNDVDENNGPFQLIKGTHTVNSLYKGIWFASQKVNSHRLTEDIIKKILDMKGNELVTFTAKKGTVVLFNSFAIHRGKPLSGGERYALTNYYFQDHLLNKVKEPLETKFKLPQ